MLYNWVQRAGTLAELRVSEDLRRGPGWYVFKDGSVGLLMKIALVLYLLSGRPATDDH